ncbi:hybrid sensor histidine kinase/response regulator [Mastigocladopsis repens]|uniref:hybrid sensor histidine kinase/response regulator n=1 Tax=Mastigocladopsis repens TaxID=221287 RepID=UPI0004750620|nr:response regulator [Mastigocladopsis repens]
MMPEQQQRILGYFIEEAKDHLNTIEQGLLNLQSTLDDPEMINEIFRAAHSIKGGAAMLGLSSIQHTSHRLEDCFKVLKEHPVKVDQKLESLFLGVSDTLKALLEHLQEPFGLTEETANTLMSEAEPVFQWLHEHLELLVKQSSPEVTNSTYSRPEVSRATLLQATLKESESWQNLQTQVIHTLREMLQLFKQTATPETRQKLWECCHQLAKLGQELNLSNWCTLCRTAGNAIANPENTYLTLAKIVITDIKQALELVVAGRDTEITISQQLQALIRVEEAIELLEIPLDLLDESVNTPAELLELPEPIISSSTFETASLDEDAQTTSHPASIELLDFEPQDKITNLSELSEQFNEHDNVPLTPSNTETNNGSEVGITELNTLADLFEDESPDLVVTWDKEEILDINAKNKLTIDLSNSNTEETDSEADFLLDEETTRVPHQETRAKAEFTRTQLFGDVLEEENLESVTQETIGLTVELSSDKTVASENVTETLTQNNSKNLIDASEEIDDKVSSLLELVLDENEPLLTGGINQIQTETIPNIELSNNQENSFDDLFLETAKADPVEENASGSRRESKIPSYKNEILTLEDLFSETEDISRTLSENESTSTNLFTTLPETDDLIHFWEPEVEEGEKGEFYPILEHDAARELEEILLAAAAEDIFGDVDQPLRSTSENLNLEDLDLSFQTEDQQFNLMLSSETNEDLFEDLTPTNPTPSSLIDTDADNPIGAYYRAGSHTEISGFSQQPEALELTPEFTTSSPDSQEDLTQPSAELDIEFLEVENENTLPVLFEETLTDNSNDVQLFESTDNPFAEQQLDFLNNLLFTEPPEGISFTVSSESSQVQGHLETVNIEVETTSDTTVAASVQPDLELELDEDFFAAETMLAEAHPEQILQNIAKGELQAEESTVQINQKNLLDEFEISEDEQELVNAQEDDLSELLASLEIEDTAFVSIATTGTAEVVSSEEEFAQKIDASLDDEFAELDKLLDQEVVSGVSAAFKPEEMSAQAKLLGVVPNQVTSGAAKEDIDIRFQELEEMVKGDLPPRPSVSRAAKFEQLMKVPVKHLDDLSNLVGELVVNRNTLEQDQERLRQFLDNLLLQVQQLNDVGARMQELYERSLLEASLLASRRNSGGSYNNRDNMDRGFTELEMDRFTPFHTLSQEMIELIVRVREAASDIDFVTDETERVARQFRQVTTQLQEGITRSRMEPFAEVTTPLERGVRESAIKCGKQAQLAIEGRDTLIDKMILGHLKDPLTHLLNNAIAHGIETPEVRQAIGKPAVGAITVRAFHQGNQTVISVTDDGAGIDPEAVKAKVIKKGIMTPEQTQSMSHHDVYDLLFQPGFTTKEKEDELAGRGVGLDVVLTRISEIRGTINIDSTIGRGTTFTIRLPLTLSICKALCCVSDKARIAFPMDGVEDTLDIPVKSIQQGSDGQKYIPWRDTLLPLRPLKEILTFNRQLSRGNVYGGNRDEEMICVVVVRSANVLIALEVDLVLNEQEIVIKQFEGPAPKPIGVAGATVLGDGRIMPIADVLEIIDIFQGRISKQRGVSLWEQKANSVETDTSGVKVDPTVLIVDDSITVRELLSMTFNKAGYRVEQARDGQEAWDKLRSGLPCDLVFCDIEMPRCDGLELLSRIQKDPSLNHLPIAMLTSRGADKHRQMAIQLGARGYFTKPYLEEALLEGASRMLNGEKLVHSSSSS